MSIVCAETIFQHCQCACRGVLQVDEVLMGAEDFNILIFSTQGEREKAASMRVCPHEGRTAQLT